MIYNIMRTLLAETVRRNGEFVEAGYTSGYSDYAYNRELNTIALNAGRCIGHTSAIVKLVRWFLDEHPRNRVVIVDNEHERNFSRFAGEKRVFLVSEFGVMSDGLNAIGINDFHLVFVEKASYVDTLVVEHLWASYRPLRYILLG